MTTKTRNRNGGASGRRRVTPDEVAEMVALRERGWTSGRTRSRERVGWQPHARSRTT